MVTSPSPSSTFWFSAHESLQRTHASIFMNPSLSATVSSNASPAALARDPAYFPCPFRI
jgi:hypothetical protein